MPEVTPEQWAAAQAAGFPPDVSQQQLLDTWNKAKNVEQAQKDVAAQLRMLGILRMKNAIEHGVDPAAATYSNLHLLSPANTPQFAPTMRAVRPPQSPQMTNYAVPGGQVYGTVSGGRFSPFSQAAMPKTNQPPQLPIATNYPGIGNVLINPKSGAIHTGAKQKGDLSPEEELTVKREQARANTGFRVATEVGTNNPAGQKAFEDAQRATNAIHQIYNKPKPQAQQGMGDVKKADESSMPNIPKVQNQKDIDSAITQANEAIRKGKDPKAVRERLKAMGIELQE